MEKTLTNSPECAIITIQAKDNPKPTGENLKGKNKQRKPKKKAKKKKQKAKVTVTYAQDAKTRVCHSGTKAILSYGNATLYAGGEVRRGRPDTGWAAIDLASIPAVDYFEDYDMVTGMNESGKEAFSNTLSVARRYNAGPRLSFPIPDYGVPQVGLDVWETLANDIATLMEQGTNVYIGCTGGHGRTGLAVSIIAGLLRSDITLDDPVTWLREVYCDNAVETSEQIQYVFDILGLPVPKGLDTDWSYQYDDRWGESYSTRWNEMASNHMRAIANEEPEDVDVEWESQENEVFINGEWHIVDKATGAILRLSDNEKINSSICRLCKGHMMVETVDDRGNPEMVICPDCDGHGIY